MINPNTPAPAGPTPTSSALNFGGPGSVTGPYTGPSTGMPWQGGGWSGASGAAAILQAAFAQGLRGQAAVDWASKNGGAGIEYYANNNTFGLPNNQYVAPNPQNASAFDLITKPGGGAAGGVGPLEPFTQPAPTFTPPSYTPPPAFQAPSIADALNAPGYQFQLQQGENALQNWAAARGTLNDSSTADALQQYGQQSAQADYQNVFNNAAQTYQTNYQTQYTDPNAIKFQGASAAYGSQQQSWQDAYNAWLAQNQLAQSGLNLGGT